MGPKGEPDTKTNWSTDSRPEDKLNSTQLTTSFIVLIQALEPVEWIKGSETAVRLILSQIYRRLLKCSFRYTLHDGCTCYSAVYGFLLFPTDGIILFVERMCFVLYVLWFSFGEVWI
jgi:hypothetical protein